MSATLRDALFGIREGGTQAVAVTAHLPAIQPAPVLPARCGEWTIRPLTFEEWQELDWTYTGCSIEFRAASPVFAEAEFTVEADRFDAVSAEASRRVTMLHHALLLAYPAPLPTPHYSCVYTRCNGQSASIRLGPMGRAWIVFGYHQPRYNVFALGFARLQRAWELLQATAPSHAEDGVADGLNALALTASPGFDADDGSLERVNEFVHCMATLERLLLPAREDAPKGMKLTPTFGRHLALCLASGSANLEAEAAAMSRLYTLRSRLIHGEVGRDGLGQEEKQDLSRGRTYLTWVLTLVMRLRLESGERVALPQQLLAAGEDRAIRDRLAVLGPAWAGRGGPGGAAGPA